MRILLDGTSVFCSPKLLLRTLSLRLLQAVHLTAILLVFSLLDLSSVNNDLDMFDQRTD